MTVHELMGILRDLPPETLVTFTDGENGRTDVNAVTMEEDWFHRELYVLVIGRK